MEQSVNKILSTIDEAIAGFQDNIPGIQKMVYEELQPILKEIEIKDGKILNNVNNLRLIGTLKNKLEKIIINANYKKSVEKFVESFTTVSNLQQDYFKQFNKQFKPKKTLPILKELSIEATINDLVGQGLNANVTSGVQEILRQNITTGGDYAALQNQMRNHILTNSTGEGSLERYTKQITTDAIHQYNAQYHEAIAQDLNFNWGRYIGSNLTTSRELCVWLTKKEWVHKTQLPDIIKGKIDDHQCKLSNTTKLPYGLIPGTNAGNFKVRRGGYNCGHQFFWVPDSAVPKNLLFEFENKDQLHNRNFITKKKAEIKTNLTEDAKDQIKQKSGLDYDNIVNLTGGIPSEKITGINHNVSFSDIRVSSLITSDQYRIERTIFTREKWIYNEYMRVNDSGGGIGLNLFLNQVIQARKSDFNYLKVSAAGSYNSKDEWNGYVTWAKFGYVMDDISKNRFNSLMKTHQRPEKNVFELVSSKEGLSFWERYGEGWAGKFDLKDGSQAMKNLQKYLDDRNIIVAL